MGAVAELVEHDCFEDVVSRVVTPGAFSLGHNVGLSEAVNSLLMQLVGAGGRLLSPGDAPQHGGYRGYVADPDDHAREIAWKPAWAIDERGPVTFGI